MSDAGDMGLGRRRQVLYWRLLAQALGGGGRTQRIEALAEEIVAEAALPSVVLDPEIGVETLLRRHPALKAPFESVKEVAEGAEAIAPEASNVPRTVAYSKLILNVFGPNAQRERLTAGQYQQWLEDVAALERYLGFDPGQLHQGQGSAGRRVGGASGGRGTGPGGHRIDIDDAQLAEELKAMESDLIKRMDLREVLADDELAKKVTPTLAVVEQLLYDKSNLSGTALKNARAIIRKYVDDLAEVLGRQVMSASTGRIDMSVPPKRIFRNLDLGRTVWKNLPNFNPADGRIYVDRLYYRRTAQKELTSKFIVVVDQSGSMVDAMVQCAILASVFAGLPRVSVSLIAYDTSAIDLTPWVHDPFEALMRTNLGGGTHGPVAMAEARQHIIDPRRTTMVWISDFYDDRSLLGMFKGLKESGVTFIPVGSVSSRGYFSVDGWFRQELKKLGTPILTGNIKKLIVELKRQLN
ncbi:MAG: VWA domain-containing protein [Polyangiaceae bacterium]